MKHALLVIFASLFLGIGYLPAQTPDIFFEIRNEAVISGGTQYQFDVYMGAGGTGTFHSEGTLFINYNTALFGTDIVTNNKLTVIHLDLLNETLFFSPTTPKYSTNQIIDSTTNTFKVSWGTNFPSLSPTTSFHTIVPDSLAPLYRFRIDILSGGNPADLAFVDTLMLGLQKHLVGANVQMPYGDGYFPIELLHFSAEQESDQAVNLYWMTASESNNDYFSIEKMDVEGDFHSIGQVVGAGTSSEVLAYQFKDETSMQRINTYRLKQVDFDGSVTFSEQVEVHIDDFGLRQFVVFPSPTTGLSWVRAKGEPENRYRLQVTDLQGKVVLESSWKGNEQQRLDLEEMPQGIYLIRISGDRGGIFTSKLLKL